MGENVPFITKHQEVKRRCFKPWRSKCPNKFFALLRGMLFTMKKNIRRVIKKIVAYGKYFLHRLTALIIVTKPFCHSRGWGRTLPDQVKGLLGEGLQNVTTSINLPTPAQDASWLFRAFLKTNSRNDPHPRSCQGFFNMTSTLNDR